MTVIIIFVVAFIGLAVVARVGLSNATRERRSMSGHRQTLDLISKVTDAPTVDRDVRTFKVEPLRPVRLDLSKLEDLTDPDLIRITSPLASDDDNSPAASASSDIGGQHDDHGEQEAGRTESAGRDTAEHMDAQSLAEEHTELIDNAQSMDNTQLIESGLIIGEEGIIDQNAGAGLESTVEIDSLAGADAASMTAALPIVDAPLLDQEESDLEADGHGSREHRVYSTSRSVPLSAMAVGAGAIAVVLGVGFFLLGRNSSTTVIQPTSSTRTSTAKTSRSATKSGSKSSSVNKKKTTAKASGQKGSSTSSSTGSSTSGSNQSTSSSTSTPSQFTPVSANSSYATYDIPGGARTIVVSASQPCWVADSDSANGPLLWDQTLPAGGSYTISSTAPSLWIKVGNAHDFQMQVNGVPVSFSSPPGVFSFDLVASSSAQSPA